MIFWEKVIRRLFPEAISIQEDWEKKTVTVEFTTKVGSVEVDFDKKLMSHLREKFGEKFLICVSCRPTGEQKNSNTNGVIGVIMRVIFKEVRFPTQPE